MSKVIPMFSSDVTNIGYEKDVIVSQKVAADYVERILDLINIIDIKVERNDDPCVRYLTSVWIKVTTINQLELAVRELQSRHNINRKVMVMCNELWRFYNT